MVRSRWFAAAVLLCAALVAFLTLSFRAAAQSVVSPFASQVFHFSSLEAAVVQPDGKVIAAGSFNWVNGATRNNLVRLNADGSVDTSWNPAPNGLVRALTLDGAGNVYVAGTFNFIGGVSRNGLAKIPLAGNGAADPTWNPNPVGTVWALAANATTVYAGGTFTAIGSQLQAGLAKLSAGGTGAADPGWTPNVSGNVYSIAIDGTHVYAGGFFTTTGSSLISFNLGRYPVGGAGGLDETWAGGTNSPVNVLALGGGNLYVGGTFSTVWGQPRNNLAKISTAGAGAVDAWNPNPLLPVFGLALDGSDLYVGGNFTSIGGQNRNRIARLSTATGLADAWNPGADVFVKGIAVGSTQVFAAGNFALIGGIGRSGFAALSKSTGSGSTAWPFVLLQGAVAALVRDDSGRTVIGGDFALVGDGFSATARNNLARFNADGTLDLTWFPSAGYVVSALELSASNLYVGGHFTSISGVGRNYIARIPMSGNGTPDTWNPNASGPVLALKLDGEGGLYAGGAYASIGGQTRNNIARLKTIDGTADSWNPGSVGTNVRALALDPSGYLFVGGDFSNIGGQLRNRLAKLSVATGAAEPWNPNADGPVYSLLLSGSLFVGGAFGNIGGQVRRGVAKVSATGAGAIDAWNPAPAVGTSVSAMALDTNGNLYLGGTFSQLSSQIKVNLARVSSNGAGALDVAWTANATNGPNPLVATIALDGSGNACVGGRFAVLANVGRSGYGCVSQSSQVAPQISSANATTFLVGIAGSFAVTATGSPVPALSMTGTLPTGVTFNSGTGTLSGTPTTGGIGMYPVTITASNGVNPNATQSFTLTVSPTVPAKPTITGIAPSSGQATVAFTTGNDGGRPIVSNTVTCTSGASTRTATGPASPLVVTGLTNGLNYSCVVTSTNDQGDSTPSDAANVTTSTFFNLGTHGFGGQSMATTSPTHVVTLTNTGELGPLTITGVTMGPQFGQTNTCGSSLAVGASCTITVTFSPAAIAGPINSTTGVDGTLAIVTNVGYFTAVFSGTAEKSLVTHYYYSILRRAPDSGGKTYWANEATRVSALGPNVNEVWFAMAQQFYTSAEYAAQGRTNNGFVTDLYNTFFNRAPDAAGRDFWVAQLDAGMPREVALTQFMFSAEFASFTSAIFGNPAVRAEINTVVDFYRGLLARLPDDGGLPFWVNKFRAAQCAAQAAAAITAEVESISSQFATSGEYLGRGRSNAQYVGDLYNAFLRRGGDLGGVQFWINQVATGAQTREQVRVQFKNSAEFQARVNAIIAQGCLA